MVYPREPGIRARRSTGLLWALLALGLPVEGSEAVHLVILHTNDLHGQCQPVPATWLNRERPPLAGGLERLAERIGTERALDRDVCVVDAGDWFRGTPEGAIDQGIGFAEILGRVGFDAMCVGNHELDHGVPQLERLLCEAELPAVLANVIDPSAGGSGLRGTRPWIMVERAGLRIAFVGLLTTVTRDITHQDVRSLELETPVDAWDRAVRELAGLADLIVPLTHMPVDECKELARKRPGIPLIIAAHDHTRLPRGIREGDTLIVENGAKAVSLGRVDLWIESGSGRVLDGEARLIDLVDPQASGPGGSVAKACKELVAKSSAGLEEVVGSLTMACERGEHRLSAPQGSWICDALLRKSGAQVAIQNKGGTRCDLAAGPLTRRQLFELLPFDNTVVSMSLTGAALESIVRKGIEDTRHRGIDVGGISIYVRTRGDSTLALERVEIGGKPLEQERTYRVVTSSYLAGGDAGYVEFKSGTDRRENPILMRELLEGEARRIGAIEPPQDARIILLPGGAEGAPAPAIEKPSAKS